MSKKEAYKLAGEILKTPGWTVLSVNMTVWGDYTVFAQPQRYKRNYLYTAHQLYSSRQWHDVRVAYERLT